MAEKRNWQTILIEAGIPVNYRVLAEIVARNILKGDYSNDRQKDA